MSSGKTKKSSTEKEGEYTKRSRAKFFFILGKMRSGRKKKSSTEKEGEYTKKSRGTAGGRRATGAERHGTAGRPPAPSTRSLTRIIEDPSTFRCLGNFMTLQLDGFKT